MGDQPAFDRYKQAVEVLHDATPNGYTQTEQGRAKADAAWDKLDEAGRDLSNSWRRR